MGEKKCPICKKISDSAYRPFCSKRCADVDLNRWLNSSYHIPAEEDFPSRSDDTSD